MQDPDFINSLLASVTGSATMEDTDVSHPHPHSVAVTATSFTSPAPPLGCFPSADAQNMLDQLTGGSSERKEEEKKGDESKDNQR